jgi:ferrous iron transport protein B
MFTSTERATLTVALIGNPNTGKSTLFGALAGVRQHVGNYPGVTVEKRTGAMRHAGQRYELVDLPGTYSLAPRSLDEMVTVDVLLGRQRGERPPDAVLSIVDASNLARNLYLVSQVLELGRPTVVALNMIDVAKNRGLSIDVARLARQLGVPVVPIQANRRTGVPQLRAALAKAVANPAAAPESPFPEAFRAEVARLESSLAEHRNGPGESQPLPRYLIERLLLDTAGYVERAVLPRCHAGFAGELAASRDRLTGSGCPAPSVETAARYAWVGQVLEGVVGHDDEKRGTVTDRVDRVLTHRLWGTLVFAVTMVLVFHSVFHGARPLMNAIDAGKALLGDWVTRGLPAGALRSLVVDGVIQGVGAILVFLPQIFILFFFVGILEDCGYMARAAYLMDRLMARVGLSGKSFIPLLSSFACAVPGIMATRVIEDRRDRLTTILIAPLMSCSARLPVYTLLIAAFIPPSAYLGGLLGLQELTLTAMYLVGIVTAVLAAMVIKRQVLRGVTPPFLMELPDYKWPSPATVLYRMIDRGWAFIRHAGTLIVAVAIVVWAVLYYPHDAEVVEAPFRAERAAIQSRLDRLAADSPERKELSGQLTRLDRNVAAAYQQQSVLGRMGRFVEPAVEPLGWDWRIGCAVIASFPAREIVVATLGVMFNAGDSRDVPPGDGSTELQASLRGATWEGTARPLFNVPVALSIMVFFALCAQCAATLAVIRRETNSWLWPVVTFGYMTTLAYLGALATYQIGCVLSG